MERKITIEEKVFYREDYQMRMLKANNLEGLLKTGGRGMNESSYYDYDVSGKISMKAMYERSKISSQDIKMFLRDMRMVVREVETYLLNIHCILLNPEYIFYENDRYFFCYYPPAQQDLWEAFHGLTEYFVKQADYQDQEGIEMIFLLHKRTMEENYSLEKLTAECLQKPAEADEAADEEELEARRVILKYLDLDEKELFDREKILHASGRETGNFWTWTPVKHLLGKRRKPKWGDWDGLHIEEEEL